jgi:glycosidase
LFTHLTPEHEAIYAYLKIYQTETILVVINFTDSGVVYALPTHLVGTRIKSSISSSEKEQQDTVPTELSLGSFEAVALVV